MEEQVRRLTSLINGLLNSSKIRAVGFEYKNDVLEINKLIDETINEIQEGVETHKIIKKGFQVKYIKGDRDRIAQVLINLLINALRYSPNSSKISVITSIKDNYIIISIKDFGIGISQINQKKVFGRFFRLNNSATEAYYGVGLGLDISLQIVRHHKGKMWVESEEGKGSVFSFSLPIFKNI